MVQNRRKDDTSAMVTNGILAGGGLISIALLTWIATSVADIPVIKSQLSTALAETADHETRIRVLEHPNGWRRANDVKGNVDGDAQFPVKKNQPEL